MWSLTVQMSRHALPFRNLPACQVGQPTAVCMAKDQNVLVGLLHYLRIVRSVCLSVLTEYTYSMSEGIPTLHLR